MTHTNKSQKEGIKEQNIMLFDPREKVRASCLENFGKADGELFYFLWERFMQVQTIWGELQVILNSSEEETALLREHIPIFCRVATDSMWREVITTIVAFRDGKVMGKSKYAGLPDLMLSIPGTHKEARVEMLEVFNEAINPLVKMRNKHIAHFSEKGIKLRTTDRLNQESIVHSINAIGAILTTYSELRGCKFPPWECGAAEKGGAKTLLSILRTYTRPASEPQTSAGSLEEPPASSSKTD